jgi:hypothetical protein
MALPRPGLISPLGNKTQRKNEMTQRDMVSAGIKLFGLCLLGLGLISACKAAESGWSAYSRLKISPHTDKIGLFTVQSHFGVADKANDSSSALYEYTLSAINYRSAQREFVGIFVQLLVGLYLCRSGKLVLRFLCGNEPKPAAQPTAAASPSLGL